MENLEGSERVMVISPHPDDVDFGCSGTIAKWSRAGMDITYVICTSGDKGTDRPMAPESIAAIREKEQVTAAEIVGVRKVVFLRLKDGEFEDLSAWVRDRFGQLGKEKGFAYAEAFRQLVIP